MPTWYLNTTNESLIRTYRVSPFDILVKDASGELKCRLKRFDCVGVGHVADDARWAIAHENMLQRQPVVEIHDLSDVIVIIDRVRGYEEMSAAWFEVKPRSMGLAELHQTMDANLTYLGTTYDDKPTLRFTLIRNDGVGGIVCYMPEYISWSYPVFHSILFELEEDGVNAVIAHDNKSQPYDPLWTPTGSINASQIMSGSITVMNLSVTSNLCEVSWFPSNSLPLDPLEIVERTGYSGSCEPRTPS